MKIDLQIHSTFSDGIESPEEIITLSKEHNISLISITDHDTVDEQTRIKSLAEKAGQKYITGVEISTSVFNKSIHILGFGYDPENTELKKLLSDITEFRMQSIAGQFDTLNTNLKNAGKKSADRDLYLTKGVAYSTIVGLVRFLHESCITEKFTDGFDLVKGIKNTALNSTPEKTIQIIHAAGGKAVISHPFAPRISLKNTHPEKADQESFIAKLKNAGLDGLEVYSTGHTEEDKQFALKMCAKYNLIFTAGSDWHGPLSETGLGIKDYLPYYLEKFGTLELTDEVVHEISKNILCT